MSEPRLVLQTHVPLMRSVVVAPGVLGTTNFLDFYGRELELRWPRLVWTGDGRPIVCAPDGCSPEATRQLEEREHVRWGSVDKWHHTTRQIELVGVDCAIVSLLVGEDEIDRSEYLYGIGEPTGPLVKRLAQFLDEWRDKLLQWVFLCTGQAVDPRVPPTSNLHVHNEGMSVWTERDGDIVGLRGLDPSVAVTLLDDHEIHGVALSEALLVRVLAHVAGDDRAPTALRLLRQGQAAVQRGDYRLALIELGAAAELTLAMGATRPLRKKKPTLGDLVKETMHSDEAERYRLGLVNPRNDAVHRADPLTRETALAAFELARDLVAPDESRGPERPERSPFRNPPNFA